MLSECQNPSFSILRPCRSFTVVFALFFVALADLPTEILQQRVNMSGKVKGTLACPAMHEGFRTAPALASCHITDQMTSVILFYGFI